MTPLPSPSPGAVAAEHRTDCLFCRIAAGEIPCHAVYQSDRVLAFLDLHPIRAGHVLAIPRAHHAYYDDIPAETAMEIMQLGQRLAPLMRSRLSAKRVAFFYTGTDIAHAHAHIVPMVENGDITSRRYIQEETVTFGPAPRMADNALADIAATITGALRELPA
ncbi:MAG: HIT domain-containing protein [Comamonadaceae bacterium]|nr:MAG: HIT domain-containing protein [Comamonadaceae bacterium]